MLLGPGSGHTLTLRVTDQYGDAFTDTDYRLQIDPSSTVNDLDTTDIDESVVSGLLYNSGRRSLSYDYGGTGPSEETVTVAGRSWWRWPSWRRSYGLLGQTSA